MLYAKTKPKEISEIIGVSLWPPSSPNLNNPLDYTIWGVLENKTTSYPNIGLLKTAIQEKWNKTYEGFILKACKSFQWHVDNIIEKMVAILSKFTVLCLSSYYVDYL